LVGAVRYLQLHQVHRALRVADHHAVPVTDVTIHGGAKLTIDGSLQVQNGRQRASQELVGRVFDSWDTPNIDPFTNTSDGAH
jgi:hypothetical protein